VQPQTSMFASASASRQLPSIDGSPGFGCTASSGAAVIGVLVVEIEFVLVAIALGGFAV
jgi:hypothetical protein